MTITDYQKKVNNIVYKFNFNWSDYVQYIHLVEEIGELGEALTVYRNDRKSGSGKMALADHSNLGEEFGDVLFDLFELASKTNINLEQALNDALVRSQNKMANLNK